MIGRLVGAHGIRGEILVFALTSEPGRFAPGERAHLSPTPEGDDRMTEVTVESARFHKGKHLLKLEEFEDRTQAEQRAGWYLVIPREEAEEAREEGEFFLFSLLGREVRTVDGRRVGEVAEVVETGGAPLLEIGEPREPTRLLPFVREFVLEVDDDAITIQPPAGWEEL